MGGCGCICCSAPIKRRLQVYGRSSYSKNVSGAKARGTIVEQRIAPWYQDVLYAVSNSQPTVNLGTTAFGHSDPYGQREWLAA